jgi:colicin import membrane protein
MKQPFLLALFSICLCSGAIAQEEPGVAAQRVRIAGERKEVEAAFTARQKQCYLKFAVNDCVKAAKSQRRERLADLRRQEISLNDAERKRKAAERSGTLEERSSPEKQEAEAQRRAKAAAQENDRKARAAEKATRRASEEAPAATPGEHRKDADEAVRRKAEAQERKASEAANNAIRYRQRLSDAQAHKEAVEKQLSDKKDPPAKPLPVPP